MFYRLEGITWITKSSANAAILMRDMLKLILCTHARPFLASVHRAWGLFANLNRAQGSAMHHTQYSWLDVHPAWWFFMLMDTFLDTPPFFHSLALFICNLNRDLDTQSQDININSPCISRNGCINFWGVHSKEEQYSNATYILTVRVILFVDK